MRGWMRIGAAMWAASLLTACGGGNGGGGPRSEPPPMRGGVEADVGKAVVAMVHAFKLPADVAEAVFLGEGPLAVNTKDGENDTDPTWVQSLDIDDDGTINETRLLWDDEDGILYAFASETFECRGGEGTVKSGMLVATYGENNARGWPPGSGFYLVGLHAGECSAPTAMLWGCRFDENGVEMKCGKGTIDVDTGALDITTIEPLEGP